MTVPTFLQERDDGRTLAGLYPSAFIPDSLFIGSGAMGVEVAHFTCERRPSPADLRSLHEARQQRRPTPVLVVVTHPVSHASIATRFGEEWAVHQGLARDQVERLCRAALEAPDRHAADAVLRAKLAQFEEPVPGLRNAGLFAMHELEHGVPRRPDWATATAQAQRLLSYRGRELVERLGFTVDTLPGPAVVLRAAGTRTAIAVFLERSDQIEPPSERYDGLSAVSYALATADREQLDFVVVTAGSVVRVYPVNPGVGTARRGRTETFVELDLATLDVTAAGYLTLLASPSALVSGGTFGQVLATSRRFAADLGSRLRDRVYEQVMPKLSQALVRAQRFRNPSRDRLQETLEMALLTLFRLLFVAYAEDKELLPYHTSSAYRDHSLKRLAQRLSEDAARDLVLGRESGWWAEVQLLWQAVDQGNRSWRVPAYNGGLFATGEGASHAAQRLASITLPDEDFVPALRDLLLDQTAEGIPGPVDFRALGVREFGTIYEGLLEQELSVAETDLTVDPASGTYLPAQAPRAQRGRRARAGTEIVVPEGEVYLHDKSGARKASGAYYTKDFAVEHLIERALDPALRDHWARLDALDTPTAADRFFDFHVADVAMGSGHFLVAAVDHIERGLSGYLAKRSLPGVRDELERLRQAAITALGPDWRGDAIEDTLLLRRQIARRCIHGVDINPLAVELARLSLWIHTFVPGLPLSFLDANLRCGNALVGIATFAEARELIGAEADDLFAISADDLLATAREPLARLARLSEATAAEVRDARKLYDKSKTAIATTEDLLTVLAASRIDEEIQAQLEQGNVATRLRRGDLFSERVVRQAERALTGLRPLHFPTAFPQVFDRSRSGFDVLLGNPPWQEATVEELAFWARHDPGLRGLNRQEQGRRVDQLKRERRDLAPVFEEEKAEAERLRAVLTSGPFPGMGTGDPDLYKAFCWRFWALAAADVGRIGVVLPRSAFAAKGSTAFREKVFDRAFEVDLTMLLNNMQWVFPEVHPQYTIALAAITRGQAGPDGPSVYLEGPYASRAAFSASRASGQRTMFAGKSVREWNDTASLPLLAHPADAEVFLKLRRAPRLDLSESGQWRARPYAELHGTNDTDLMDLRSERRPRGYWPVFKGESFDLWTSDRGLGSYYGWADPDVVVPALQQKRLAAVRREGSPFAEFTGAWAESKKTLPCFHPRIAFRDVSRATDSRTMRVALLPPKVVITNAAPYLLWPRGEVADQAFLLGVLSSIPLDWYARRFVETHLNYFVFNPLPIPRPAAGQALRHRVISLAGRLAVQNDDRFEVWGAAIGIRPAALEPAEKDDLIAELDAAVAILYGLDEREVIHIFSTFHEGWNAAERLAAVRRHFVRLRPQA